MTLKERVDRHDREVAAIRKLILTGMKMINSLAAAQKRTDANLNRLEAKVDQLAGKVDSLVDSLRRGGNGHSRRKLDLS